MSVLSDLEGRVEEVKCEICAKICKYIDKADAGELTEGELDDKCGECPLLKL